MLTIQSWLIIARQPRVLAMQSDIFFFLLTDSLLQVAVADLESGPCWRV